MVYPSYKEIPSFEECEKIVNECEAFCHSVQEIHGEEVHSFKYNLNVPNMWEGYGRINLRGITFDGHGNLLALPFPKFFNQGENKCVGDLDFNDVETILEKVDGSLISFFEIAGVTELKSMKSVYSDVAVSARAVFNGDPLLKNFVEGKLALGLTPMFEFVSPNHRIVIDYGPDPSFHYLGSRNMKTGEIVPPSKDESSIRSFDDMIVAREYIEESGVEGVVLTFKNGLMMKMKSQEYCEIHRVLENITPKKVVNSIIEGKYDDLVGVLHQHNLTTDLARADAIYRKYHEFFQENKKKAVDYHKSALHLSRKEIASELFSSPDRDKLLGGSVMALLDGKDISIGLNKHITKLVREWEF